MDEVVEDTEEDIEGKAEVENTEEEEVVGKAIIEVGAGQTMVDRK